jgi:hypothetical protein
MILGSAAGRWGKTMAQELAYYIFLASAGVSVRGKIFLQKKHLGQNFFGDPIFTKFGF